MKSEHHIFINKIYVFEIHFLDSEIYWTLKFNYYYYNNLFN